MHHVRLEVARAYPNDAGRAIARLDPDTLLHLELSPGDVVEIGGTNSAAATVSRADRQDWNTDTVRVDGFTRDNAGVDLGERVAIRPAHPETADRVVFAPPEEECMEFGEDAIELLEHQLRGRPVVSGNLVPVTSAANHPFAHSAGRAIPLVAGPTEPDGVVVIDEETEIELRDVPLEASSREAEWESDES